MEWKTALTVAAFTALSFSVGHWFAGQTSRLVGTAFASGNEQEAEMSRHGGWRGPQVGRHGSRWFCQSDTKGRLDRLEKFAIDELDLTPQQVVHLAAIKSAINDGLGQSEAFCGSSAGKRLDSDQDPSEMLATIRVQLKAFETLLNDVEGPLQAFYASLSEIQKNRIRKLQDHRRQGGSRWHRL